MAPEPPHPNQEPRGEPVPDFEQALSNLSNPELLSALDLALLELEKRLFRYAKVGPELLEMADEGLVLAARAKARLTQSLSAAQHAEGHLQVVGWASGVPPARAPLGTPSRACLVLLRRIPSSGTQVSSDAGRCGLVHELSGKIILRSSPLMCKTRFYSSSSLIRLKGEDCQAMDLKNAH
jgi:hypothetical protein